MRLVLLAGALCLFVAAPAAAHAAGRQLGTRSTIAGAASPSNSTAPNSFAMGAIGPPSLRLQDEFDANSRLKKFPGLAASVVRAEELLACSVAVRCATRAPIEQGAVAQLG